MNNTDLAILLRGVNVAFDLIEQRITDLETENEHLDKEYRRLIEWVFNECD